MLRLAGDIGGTNTRLVIADVSHSAACIISEKNFPSQNYESLAHIVGHFLGGLHINETIDSACFALAGPVINGACKLTNLPWSISESHLRNELNIPRVKLLNDFSAVSHGISYLSEDDLLVIQQGGCDEMSYYGNEQDAVVIGAGTGLGVSHRVWIDNRYHILPSETGHVGFAPADNQQTQLLSWLQQDNQYVSLESILSGPGLYRIYQFLKTHSSIKESSEVSHVLLSSDPAVVISQFGLNDQDELCSKTIELFVSIYGSIAGDVALHYYPVNLLYIAGGIAPRFKTRMASSLFLQAFNNKGLMSQNMSKITVKLIVNDKVGLIGALNYDAA